VFSAASGLKSGQFDRKTDSSVVESDKVSDNANGTVAWFAVLGNRIEFRLGKELCTA
jgi:hypothetical protein